MATGSGFLDHPERHRELFHWERRGRLSLYYCDECGELIWAWPLGETGGPRKAHCAKCGAVSAFNAKGERLASVPSGDALRAETLGVSVETLHEMDAALLRLAGLQGKGDEG